jgi:hypothetical protein
MDDMDDMDAMDFMAANARKRARFALGGSLEVASLRR